MDSRLRLFRTIGQPKLYSSNLSTQPGLNDRGALISPTLLDYDPTLQSQLSIYCS